MEATDYSNFAAHVYLDHHHPPTLWNIVRGGFDSVDHLPHDEQKFAISVAMGSMIANGSFRRLEAELSLEMVRQQVAPDSVSRLTGLFAFDDLDSLAQIWDANDWGGHFEQQYLADVGVCAKRSSRHDSNWITAIMARDCSLLPSWQAAAEAYWSGAARPAMTPIWERIISGTFCIWSMHSKENAAREIRTLWPRSWNLLTWCMNCFAVGSIDGQIYPGLMLTNDGVYLHHYLRLKQTDDSSLHDRIDMLAKKYPEIYMRPDGTDNLVLPDLSGFSTQIPLTNAIPPSRLKSLFEKVQSGQ